MSKAKIKAIRVQVLALMDKAGELASKVEDLVDEGDDVLSGAQYALEDGDLGTAIDCLDEYLGEAADE